MSVATRILAPLGLLGLLLGALLGESTWQAWTASRDAAVGEALSRHTAALTVAAGLLAAERGETNGLLAAAAPTSDGGWSRVQSLREEAEAMIAAITDGSYHPFTGPINKQDGTPFLAEGEVATDEQLVAMNFYVEGMVGDVPS